MNINRMMRICKEMYDPCIRYNHFAFIVRRNRVVCFGRNKPFKTHPACTDYRFNAIHAEIDAIFNAPRRVVAQAHKYGLVSIRVRKNMEFGLAKPCRLCYNIIRRLGFNEIWYSTNEGEIVQLVG